jgi:hypothetical protein
VTRKRQALPCGVATTSFILSTIPKSDDERTRRAGRDTGNAMEDTAGTVADDDALQMTMSKHSKQACTMMRPAQHEEDVTPIQRNGHVHMLARTRARNSFLVAGHSAIDLRPLDVTATAMT